MDTSIFLNPEMHHKSGGNEFNVNLTINDNGKELKGYDEALRSMDDIYSSKNHFILHFAIVIYF